MAKLTDLEEFREAPSYGGPMAAGGSACGLDPARKYRPFPSVDLPGRCWPTAKITAPPIWCSVDLRDGNQALINPMDLKQKLRFFRMLVAMGFKEIEIGFPSASRIEFEFTRHLIENGLIPDDVTIQVLSQCRGPLIERTFDAIAGAKRAIVHIYNSTSPIQRRIVFKKDRREIAAIAEAGARMVKDLAEKTSDTQVVLEYSPESFSGTELDFSIEVCERVMDVWEPTPEDPMIVNLPATVEMSTPTTFADQIEWCARNLKSRDCATLSVHPHNDRGTAVAAAELALMAGADRIEGTLFGNGERTGNVDVITLALNLWTQGIDPGLDLSDIHSIKQVAESCTRLPVHPRHPYAGDLVFTAFSGSHQDAISKVLKHRKGQNDPRWDVPYLPLDPADIGRSYDGTIRINSQSGKGGISYIMEEVYGFPLPYRLQIEFAQIAQDRAEKTGSELSPAEIWELFEDEYLSVSYDRDLGNIHISERTGGTAEAELCEIEGEFYLAGQVHRISGLGDTPLAAFLDGIGRKTGADLRINDFSERHVHEEGGVETVTYIELRDDDGKANYGIGRDKSAVNASLRAVVSALYRMESDLLTEVLKLRKAAGP